MVATFITMYKGSTLTWNKGREKRKEKEKKKRMKKINKINERQKD